MLTSISKKETRLSSYPKLRARVKETLLLGQQKIEQAKVQTYWETGRLIHEHILHHQDRAGYGERVLLRLANDIEVEVTLLKRTLKFFRLFQKGADRHQLSWSHYRALLTVEDEHQRFALARQAEEKDWTSPVLEEKVREIHQRQVLDDRLKHSGMTSKLLTPKLGKAGVYKMLEDSGSLAVDLGFTSYCTLSVQNPQGSGGRYLKHRFQVKPGDYVFWRGDGPPKKIVASEKDLFTYEAEVLKVVDGDTVWMKIWLADDMFLKEKLRLRDIDAPEIDTAAGKKAKRFVEEQIAGAGKILITTTKPDKYDRYLSDIFVTNEKGEQVFLNNLLLQQGLATLKTDYSFSDWGDLE